jgi:hypothetical protein
VSGGSVAINKSVNQLIDWRLEMDMMERLRNIDDTRSAAWTDAVDDTRSAAWEGAVDDTRAAAWTDAAK